MQISLTSQDIQQLKSKGISQIDIEKQISFFERGFPFLDIINTATISKGITTVTTYDIDKYSKEWNRYINSNKTIVKFVPASGAASRMFKDLFEYMDTIADLPENDFIKTFFINIHRFAFYNELNDKCLQNEGKNIDELINNNQFKVIVKNLLTSKGLNYGDLPKGLLKFHSYNNSSRTPVEEHLSEGSMYAKNAEGTVNIHFTISNEHRILFESLIQNIQNEYEKKLGTKFNINFSEQKSKTDTIAVNTDNTPFREDGRLLFRPGGHGALIENLNDIQADIIFIKNIDNVVPDKLKEEESKYKKLLAGYLIKIQEQIFNYLNLIDSGEYKREQLLEILHFVQDILNIKNPDTKYLEDAELVLYLKKKLNRPIRVCGMVKNIGEPGGGPFFTVNTDGTISLQILESSQIDLDNPKIKEMFDNGTHFNPVDIVCAVRDYKGHKFDLKNYVDKNTGFISKKSKNGKELKALELPGLWNGAMSDWNTIFIEVPLSTFNPVKTVNDLLRKEHQNTIE